MTKVQVDEELKEILPTFLKNRENDCQTLKEYIENKDFAALKKLGHKVSGSSGGYGFSELGKIAKEIELAANDQDEAKLNDLISRFINYVHSVEVEYV